jgi:hypothetical protein
MFAKLAAIIGSRSGGYARYDAGSNSLVVIRQGESIERRIPCLNLSPRTFKVYGIEVQGDAVDVLIGPQASPRPDRRLRYFFSSLTGGSTHRL